MMALGRRRCPSNTIDRTTTAKQVYRLVGPWTAPVEAATSRVTGRGLHGKKNGCNEPRARQGGIGTQGTVVTVLEAGTATTTAVGVSIAATEWQPPTHEPSGTFGRSAENGQESRTQTTKQHMGVAEAGAAENGMLGAFVHARFFCFSPASTRY